MANYKYFLQRDICVFIMATKSYTKGLNAQLKASYDHLDGARAIKTASKNSNLFIDDEDGSKVLLSNGTIHVSSLSDADLRQAETTEAVEGFKHLIFAAEHQMTTYEASILNDLFSQYQNEYGLELLEFMHKYIQGSHATDVTNALYNKLLEKEDNMIKTNPSAYKDLMRRNHSAHDKNI